MKNILSFLIVLFSYYTALAQNSNQQAQINPPQLPNIVPPSPSVANLMRFDELPVNYYTGQPDISLPLVSAQSKDFSIPISLSYSTLGNRVDERSGIVGTGWSISGDIVISRTVMGIRDDKYPTQAPFNYGIYFTGYEDFNLNDYDFFEFLEQYYFQKELQNYLWNTGGLGSSMYPINSDSTYKNGGFDKEYDLFHLSLNGVNAKFIIVKDHIGYNVEYLKNDSNVIVDVTFSNDEIDSFIVTDNLGRKYILDQKEITTTNSNSATVPQGDNVQPTLGGQQVTDSYVSAWKVSGIYNYSWQMIAEYFYEDIGEGLPMARNITKYEIPEISKKSIYDKYLRYTAVESGYDVYNKRVLKPLKSYSFNQVSIITKKIQRIKLNDSSNLIFYYSVSHPEYVGQTGAKLDSIIKTKPLQNINDFENEIDPKKVKTIRFSYDSINTINNSNFAPNFSRLYLKNVEHYDNINNESETYDIKYNDYLTEGFGSINKDNWGFYKSPYPNGTPQVFRTDGSTADVDHITKGLIKSITYPNGGIKEFTFESNTIYHMGSRELTIDEFKKKNPINWNKFTINLNNTGNLPSQETITINEETEFTIKSNANCNNSPNPGDTGIYGPSDGDSSGAGSEDSNYSGNMDSGTPGLTLFEIMKIENNQETRIGAVHFDCERIVYQNLTLEPGTYVFRFHPESQTSAQQLVDIYGRDYKTIITKEVPGGGVRIKNIKFYDSETNLEPKYHKQYVYRESYIPEFFNNDTITSPEENLPNNYYFRQSSSGVTDGFHTNVKVYNHSITHHLASLINEVGGNSNLIKLRHGRLPLSAKTVSIVYKVTEELNAVYASLTQNSYVGYEKVWVTHMDGSKESFEYSSPNGNNSYDATYVYPFLPNEDRSIYQGLLQKHNSFSHDMNILKEIDYGYDIVQNRVGVSLFTYQQIDNCVWNQYYRQFEDYINKTPLPNDAYWNSNSNAGMAIYDNCVTISNYYSTFRVNFKEHFYEKSLQKEIKTTNYYYNADGSLADTLTQISDTDYWPETYQPKSTTTTTYSSNNEVVEFSKQVMYYPYNTPAWYSWNIQALLNTNRIAEPVAVETFNTDKLTSKLAKVYSSPTDISPVQNSTNSTNSIFELSEVLFAKSNQALDSKIKYEQYDQDSNVLQVRQTGDVPISYIYGYHNSKPIAKLVNIAYNQINPNLITSLQAAADADANCLGANCQQTEDDLRNLLEQLRSTYSNAQITTYTYDPLIGVTSVTDPRGQSLYYEYGAFNRLERIKDEQGHIVEEYDYNYRQTSNQ
ncbi:RHS repeat protein [Psychroflexus sp. ALD_RP9]|uniref:RHS repeat protein n=1 Tax=Psychroflexus sp. ALD_RP9 TaxID=2777186 RepID=UPI001A8EB5C4|nr:RHS repeat protein [Psychroflexus sp. ALD_RP9]QSS96308.1 RHS repeat protein [Psychroflexus sp. ALD_RP9]